MKIDIHTANPDFSSSAQHQLVQVANILDEEGFFTEVSVADESIFTHVVCDSRMVSKNSLFVARRGATLDGHQFIFSAMEGGCSHFMVEKSWWKNSDFSNQHADRILADQIQFLIVEGSVELALFAWAKAYRKSLSHIFVIAISGSYGKTSTKELLHCILSLHLRCQATEGNLNTPIGCAITILGLVKKTEVAILELGIDHEGEMALLCSIVQANAGLLTGIGRAHIGAFSSQRILALEKGQLYCHLTPYSNPNSNLCNILPNSRSLAFLPADSEYVSLLEDLVATQTHTDRHYYSSNIVSNTSICVRDMGWDGLLFDYKGVQFSLRTFGLHTQNILWSAAIIAEQFGLKPLDIARGAELYRPLFGRGELFTGILKNTQIPTRKNLAYKEVRVLQDCYNASPESTFALVEMLMNWKIEENLSLVFVLADMLELGEQSSAIHIELAYKLIPLLDRYRDQSRPICIIFYGLLIEKTWKIVKEKIGDSPWISLFYCKDNPFDIHNQKRLVLCVSDAIHAQKTTLLVLKGARSMQLEMVSKKLFWNRVNDEKHC